MRRFTMLMLLVVLCAFCADRDLVGIYAGEWKSAASGNGGALHMTLELSGDAWKSVTSFMVDTAEVKTVTHEFTLKDSKIDASYDFEIQGASLRSHMTATWDGSAWRGRYETSVVGGDPVDAGTWTAGRAK